MKERSRVEEDRLKKLAELRKLGVNPYGERYPDAVSAAEALALYEEGKSGVAVKTAGRMTALRRHGKAAFLDLRDGTGRIQAYVKKDVVGDDAYEVFKMLDLWDIIGVEGTLDKTRTGEITVFVETFRLLSKSIAPPPEKWHGLTDVETRYRQRYTDLAANPEVMETFKTRVRIIRLIREYLDNLGYLEVETPMMHHIAGGAAAKPFITHHNTLDMDLFLRISPELHLKRLIVGGMRRVYEINRNFRNEGISTRHNPEFTMMEMYEAFSDLEGMMERTEGLIQYVREKLGLPEKLDWLDMTVDLKSPWRRAKYWDLFDEHVGINRADAKALKKKAVELQLDLVGTETAVELALDLWEELVEPHLVNPTFVYGYPVEVCPLAKSFPDDETIAMRSELFIGRMEFANMYSELNDPAEQERRFREQLADAKGEWARLDEDFVRALEVGLPATGGQGLGIDRVVMLFTGAKSIRDVILFPLMRDTRDKPETDQEPG